MEPIYLSAEFYGGDVAWGMWPQFRYELCIIKHFFETDAQRNMRAAVLCRKSLKAAFQ